MKSFIRGAISATRAAAPLHQCWSHMSQTMIAVFFGSQFNVLYVHSNWPLLSGDCTRLHAYSFRSPVAGSAAAQRAASTNATVNVIDREKMPFMVITFQVGVRGGWASLVGSMRSYIIQQKPGVLHSPELGDCPNFRGHRGEAVVDENGTVPFDAAFRGDCPNFRGHRGEPWYENGTVPF